MSEGITPSSRMMNQGALQNVTDDNNDTQSAKDELLLIPYRN